MSAMRTALSSGYHTMAPTAESSMSNTHLRLSPLIQIAPDYQMPNVPQPTAVPNTSQRVIASARRTQSSASKRSTTQNMHQQVLRNQQLAAVEEREMNNQLIAGSSNGNDSSGMSYSNTEQWMRDHMFSTTNRPSTPSVLSCQRSHVSIASQASNGSRFSQMSIKTDLSIHTDMNGMSMQTLQGYNSFFDISSSSASTFTEVELEELLGIIEGTKKKNFMKVHTKTTRLNNANGGLHHLYTRLRDKAYVTFSVDAQVKIVKVLIGFSFEAGGSSTGVVWHCMAIIHKITTSTRATPLLFEQIYGKTLIISFIIGCLSTEGLDCVDMAALVLYKFLSQRRVNVAITDNTVRQDILVLLMKASNTQLKRSLIWDCIHQLIRSTTTMDYFLQSYGLDFCVTNLENNIEEAVLVPIVRVINKLIDYKTRANAVECMDYIIGRGGLDSLTKLLDHGSPRLLLEIAEVLRKIGYKVQNLNLQPNGQQSLIVAMQRSIRLFGSSELMLVDLITGFLCNITTCNFVTEAFANHETILSILKIIEVTCNKVCDSKGSQDQLVEIIDNLLCCLGNVISNRNACWQLYSIPEVMVLFVEMLYFFGQSSGFNCFHRIVRIFNLVLRMFPEAIPRLHEVRSRKKWFELSSNCREHLPLLGRYPR
ncbi:hypothetical protein M3Y94_00283300 [Aphelenchoides besseyi]|nr:hypothetical protein M3Y94_00283300 [Aphelenchoides besseyi]